MTLICRKRHGSVLCSPHAHARIASVDVVDACRADGVLAVLTGADVVKEGLGALPCHAFPQATPGSRHYRRFRQYSRPTRFAMSATGWLRDR